jgi:hypothetical protein
MKATIILAAAMAATSAIASDDRPIQWWWVVPEEKPVFVGPLDRIRYTVAYDGKSVTPIVGQQIATLDGFLGRDLQVWFPVVGLHDNRASFGAALVMPFRIARNADLYLGLAGRFVPQSRPSGSLILGITIK